MFGITAPRFFLKMLTRRGSEHSLPMGSSSTLSSPLDYDLDFPSSEEKLATSLRKRMLQMPPPELVRRRIAEPGKGEKRRDKRVSYFDKAREKEAQPKARTTDSLVSTSSKDILFQKEDRASVYPLVSVTRFWVSPGTLRVL